MALCGASRADCPRASFVEWKGSWSGERNVIGDGCVRGGAVHVARRLEDLIGEFRAHLLSVRLALGRLLRHLRLAVAAYGVLLISLLLAGLAWYYVRNTVEARDQVRFDETIRATQAAVDRREDGYLHAPVGGPGVVSGQQGGRARRVGELRRGHRDQGSARRPAGAWLRQICKARREGGFRQ